MKDLIKEYISKKNNGSTIIILEWSIIDANCVVSFDIDDNFARKTINIWEMLEFVINKKQSTSLIQQCCGLIVKMVSGHKKQKLYT